MNMLLFAVALASFMIYSFAIKWIFSSAQGVGQRMQALKVCGAISAVTHLWAIWHAPSTIDFHALAALVFYISGIGVFLAAWKALAGYRLTLAFSPDEPTRLVDQGIYARVRHPFYLAYSLTWLGGVTGAPSRWTTITAAVMFGFYWQAVRLEEAKFENSNLGFAYREYKSRAGMFWPRY
jgi:protein-S-isoprenylcysteine O-methyltransferase Ste14